MTVAALYVDTARGPYAQMPGVECWGYATRDGSQWDMFAPTRDASEYAGPHPVVAHPPCGPWGRFWWNYKGGEGDRMCAIHAVRQVRAYGGVLEHPAQSGLWAAHLDSKRGPALLAHGLPQPGAVDAFGGRTVEVNQCDWGHRARKPTWLYVVGVELPEAPTPREPTHVMVRLLRNGNDWPELPKRERHLTPLAFARWLVLAARSAQQ